MNEKKEEFLKRLYNTFRIEAEEHIRMISTGLLELEKNPGRESFQEIVEATFREAHSLKGAARSVDMRDVETICQRLENVLSSLKRGDVTLSIQLLDLAHQAINFISQCVMTPPEDRAPSHRALLRKLSVQFDELVKSSAPAVNQDSQAEIPAGETAGNNKTTATDEKGRKELSQKPVKQALTETVRIPSARLDPILLQAEEMIMIKMTTVQRYMELMEINKAISSIIDRSGKNGSRPCSAVSVQKAGIPPAEGADYYPVRERLESVMHAAERDMHFTKRMVDDHLESIKQLLMLPVATLVEVFPKLVRDLSRDQGKETELIINGTEIEVDKRILEELKDPLIHILRNCISHGIKKPGERKDLNKPVKGTIELVFRIKNSRNLEIIISDDGEGIDTEKVYATALKTGLITDTGVDKPEQNDIMSLIFMSGVSTSPIITDISGRGLGLAIVHEKIVKLGGRVHVESTKGAGTIFCITLPLSLATFRGVLVRAGENIFILPTVNVEQAIRLKEDEINSVGNHQTIDVNGRVISFTRLRDVLGLTVPANAMRYHNRDILAVIISYGGSHIAFQVDEVINEQQVIVKGLGKQLNRVRNISGATVLASGKVVPILNVGDLIKSAVNLKTQSDLSVQGKRSILPAEKILVAEDSITSRTLIRNILESAGYRVSTAVDGVDAITQVKSDEFNLVVSDVDMPRMNGFELTAKIRSDENIRNIPVILITALESMEDREHGVEVGANAYIVKSSFDQSNLLEVIKRII